MLNQHLENGVLREYTAWAVSLGEADAWNRAFQQSSRFNSDDDLISDDYLLPLTLLIAVTMFANTIRPSSSSSYDDGWSSGFSGGFDGGGGGAAAAVVAGKPSES